MSRVIWHDGSLVRGEPAGASGYGVFTTVGCDGGQPLLWDRHARRLEGSRAETFPRATARIPGERELVDLLATNRLGGPARLRVTVRRGGRTGEITVTAGCEALRESGPGLSPLHLSSVPRPVSAWSVGHKWLARAVLDDVRERATTGGADDALLLTAEGEIMETPVANLFVRFAGVLVTPPAPADCLPGVMRAWLVDRAPALARISHRLPAATV